MTFTAVPVASVPVRVTVTLPMPLSPAWRMPSLFKSTNTEPLTVPPSSPKVSLAEVAPATTTIFEMTSVVLLPAMTTPFFASSPSVYPAGCVSVMV